MKISSIIRCKNEEDWIGHAIQSFVDFFPDGELLILNDHSNDNSKDIVKMFDKFNIRWFDIEDYTPGKSINFGASKAEHEVVLVQSAHTIIKHINTKNLFSNLEKYVAIFGNQIPIYHGKRITKRYIWSHFKENHQEENLFSNIENRYFLHNAFCFYRKNFLLENKFDENLHGKEDRYWAADIVKKGHSFYYDSINLSSYHHYTKNGATWKGLG
jgi:glycosyltransferase involved in cell wall biosynthesis